MFSSITQSAAMTSIPTKSRTAPRPGDRPGAPVSQFGKHLSLVAGLTCLAGFLVDIVTISSPIDPLAIEWRISFLQLAGDRSIILFFAAALLLYSTHSQYRIRRRLSLASLAIGIALLMACLLVIRDSLIIKDETVRNISLQAQQAQTQIEATQNNDTLSSPVPDRQLQQLSQQLTLQADTLKDSARKGIIQAGITSVGNLIVVGIGLIGLSHVGLARNR